MVARAPQDLSMPLMHGIGLSYYPRYISAAWKVKPVLTCNMYPAIATSVDVERIFSHGRLLLSHVRNRLTAQTT